VEPHVKDLSADFSALCSVSTWTAESCDNVNKTNWDLFMHRKPDLAWSETLMPVVLEGWRPIQDRLLAFLDTQPKPASAFPSVYDSIYRWCIRNYGAEKLEHVRLHAVDIIMHFWRCLVERYGKDMFGSSSHCLTRYAAVWPHFIREVAFAENCLSFFRRNGWHTIQGDGGYGRICRVDDQLVQEFETFGPYKCRRMPADKFEFRNWCGGDFPQKFH